MTTRDELESATEQEILSRLADADDEALQAVMYEAGSRCLFTAVNPLIRLLAHSNNDVRQAAVESLGDIGDERAAADIVKLARQEGLPVELRDTIAWTLGILRSQEAVPLLVEMLKAEEVSVRSCAAGALAVIGANARAVRPSLFAIFAKPGGSTFVKDFYFFVKQGGLQQEWGVDWVIIEAKTMELARVEAVRRSGFSGLYCAKCGYEDIDCRCSNEIPTRIP